MSSLRPDSVRDRASKATRGALEFLPEVGPYEAAAWAGTWAHRFRSPSPVAWLANSAMSPSSATFA